MGWLAYCSYGFAGPPFDEPRDEPVKDSSPQTDNASEAPVAGKRQLQTGRVVLLKDALKRRGMTVAEEMAEQAVLETDDGTLLPILADWRGRAFFQDAQLRDRKVELVTYRRPGLPYLQVLMVFTFDEDGARQFTDYWCDVCSIPMYEIKPCECCQGEIRLRFRKQGLPDYLRGEEPGAQPAVPAAE